MQDVGRFPRRQAARALGAIELRLERLRQAMVRREHDDALDVAAPEPLEELRARDLGVGGHGWRIAAVRLAT
jgi:hypothetical protein